MKYKHLIEWTFKCEHIGGEALRWLCTTVAADQRMESSGGAFPPARRDNLSQLQYTLVDRRLYFCNIDDARLRLNKVI